MCSPVLCGAKISPSPVVLVFFFFDKELCFLVLYGHNSYLALFLSTWISSVMKTMVTINSPSLYSSRSQIFFATVDDGSPT